jgi:hypothetical protein
VINIANHEQPLSWPDIVPGDDPTDEDYVAAANVQLLLDQTEAALRSQIDGVRQIFGRLATVLTQATTLASAAAAGLFWLRTHETNGWLFAAASAAIASWTVAAIAAAVGMRAAQFGAPGINPLEAYKKEVLSQSERDMQLWVVKSHGGTITTGKRASAKLTRWLNVAITCLAMGPAVFLATVVVSLFF